MFTADKIDDHGLWLGDITAAENFEALDKYKISHLLTILDYQPTPIDKTRTYLYIHANDFHSTDLITNEFEKCFHFIDKALEQGHQVLIHCHAGVSRSVTIAAMYLMRKYCLTRQQALERIINKRRYWTVLPNEGFIQQLDLFYQMNYQIDYENQLYKQFINQLFNTNQSNKTTTPVILCSDTETEREYQCKNCHLKLFTNNDIQKHEDKSKILCNNNDQLFTYYLDWIDDIFVNPFGNITCSNCKNLLGEYSLEGLRCKSCQQWLKPAFVFQCQLIE